MELTNVYIMSFLSLCCIREISWQFYFDIKPLYCAQEKNLNVSTFLTAILFGSFVRKKCLYRNVPDARSR